MNSIKQADVVISTVGHSLLGEQYKIISAIKEAGNVKVLLKSPLSSSFFVLALPLVYSTSCLIRFEFVISCIDGKAV